MKTSSILTRLATGFLAASVSLAASGPAFAAGSATAPAAKSGAIKVAFVDLQAAILKTEDGKAAKAKIEKEAMARREELLKQQNELKKLDDEFQQQASVLSEADKQQKQKDLMARAQKFQAAQMSFEGEFRQKEAQQTQVIVQKLHALLQELAKKKGYDLVYERSLGAILYSASADDLTDELVKEYNSRSKSGK